jgi:hypothetical protein
MPRLKLLLCAAALTFVVGCQRHYTITFVNMTGEDLTVTLEGPGHIEPSPPSTPLARRGGRGIFKVAVPEDELPANYAWHANGNQGSIIVQKDSNKTLIVNVPKH